MNIDKLVELAIKAKENAYAPYSKFRVGAALLTSNGNVYTGVNVENVSFGATNCAERTAIYSSVSAGDKEIEAIAIASDANDFIYPCGICRQVIAEFASKDIKIVCSNKKGEYKILNLEEILPVSFKKMNC